MICIENLTVKLPKVKALKNINLEVKAGQRLGLVGESGSGKTMLGLSLLGITPDPAINSGILKINNLNMLNASEDEWTKLRLHRIAMVFLPMLRSTSGSDSARPPGSSARLTHTILHFPEEFQ